MEELFPIAFTKMNGTGNDFVVIDHRRNFLPPDRHAEFSRRVCRRMYSAGADGVILIENSEAADFAWRFYNSDGSVAEMCGNGARCAARFAYRHGIAGRRMRFETLAGVIEAEICDDEEVRVRMTSPFGFRDNIVLTIDGQELRAVFINTGVPHAVIFADAEDVPVKGWGRQIRFHAEFQPQGTNANFVTVLGPGRIRSRTYERGVEDETRACGTGAVASAIVAALCRGVATPVEVVTSGGERLTVDFTVQQDGGVADVHLKGPARMAYHGELTAEALL